MQLSSITPDPTALRALSHPVRLRILGLLRVEGPSTASALATRLGLNSGVTSYHLRQLALHGFVVDETSRGDGRDRWWKAAHKSTRSGEAVESTPEGREASDAFGQAIAVVHTEQLQRAVEERPLLPSPWRHASSLSDWGLSVTPERAKELADALAAVVDGWEEDSTDRDDVEEFVVMLHAFPRPGRLGEPGSS
ncbi:MAG: helix-turn-helix domain-containing protein [Actinomycetota bacterium]|jgi:DNA-binding transcriptional ArsR family regulator|nr:helix-turn-helix domain-containing protein [Actinomycetota bacterium]